MALTFPQSFLILINSHNKLYTHNLQALNFINLHNMPIKLIYFDSV